MKVSLLSFILVLISAVLTLNFSTFTHPILLITLPGFLFGIAITIPNVLPDYKKHMKQIRTILIYPIIYAISVAFYTVFEFVTSSASDKSPFLIIGIISGIAIGITYDWQFNLKNKPIGIFTIVTASVIALILGDYFYPYPNDKEENIGKLIAFWEIIVGLALLVNTKMERTVSTAS
jgi:hypothetical protein